MLNLHKNNIIHYTKLFSVFIILQLLSGGAYSKNTVIIKKTNKTGCYHLGENIELMGKGFGKASPSKYLILQGKKKQHVIFKIKQWKDNKISAQLPTALTLDESSSYILGILEDTRWVSNRDKRIVLCGTANKIKPLLKENLQKNPRKTLMPVPKNLWPKDVTPSGRLPANDKKGSVEDDVSVVSRPGPFQQRSSQRQTTNLGGLGIPPRVDLGVNKSVQKPNAMEVNEIVVVTATLDEAIALARFVQQYSLRVKRRNSYVGLELVVTVLHVPKEYLTIDVVVQLRESYPELWIDFNHRYQLLSSGRRLTSNSKIWAYDMLGWTDAHRDCQSKPKLGIIDTGISQIDLIEQKNIKHKSLLSNGVKPAKKNHGTAIASLLLGSPQRNIPGLLPKAILYSASIFRQRTKTQVDTTAELIIKALNWMVEKQVTVINLSLGGPRSLAVEVAIRRVLEKGFVVVSAAGVDEQGEPLYPAAQEGVIAVRAIDVNAKPFSKNIHGDYIYFSAPGVDLWLLNEKGDGRYLSGSSFAAPIVSAGYALLNNNLDTGDLLKNTVRDLGEPGKDRYFGWGQLLVHGLCQ